ncbi:MAG: filamentous hemagglutinin N-terminal domain-containing protein, partial [Desulfobacterales bacterium]|nr:filamentous hemagglutinin N-terminal domain-containing protein [Desulfobacterales bacterium]
MRRNLVGKKVTPYLLMVMIYSLMFPVQIFALPQGGQVVAGQANIAQTDAMSMQINQATSQAAINWQQFSIATPESVRFIQPDASAVALNRVVGIDPSLIYGQLTANGTVILVNRAGIFMGPSGRIDVGSFVASTLDITNEDFLAGKYSFLQNLDSSLSTIVNLGTIAASPGGSVSLIAPGIENQGTILASLGKVNLGAGEAVSLSFAGNELISFAVDKAVVNQVMGPDGQPMEDGILNTGTINADGGEVTLSARVAYDAIKSVVNNQGVIEARSIDEHNGTIRLLGNDQGIVLNSGTLDVSGDDAGETGGTIEVTGEKVGLVHYSEMLASGRSGGGKVYIGGGYQGKDPVIKNGKITYVGADAKIEADAIDSGDGGEVVVWADDTTRFYGDISATGGALGGDGGTVEVSGKENLGFYGFVDTRAPLGLTGTLLLDPTDLTITDTPALSGSLDISLPDIFAVEGTSESVSAGALEALSGATDIILQATDTITINPLTTAGKGSGNDAELALSASSSVQFIAGAGGIDAGGNLIWVTGGGDLIIDAMGATNTVGAGDGVISVQELRTDSGNISLAGTTITAGILNAGGGLSVTADTFNQNGAISTSGQIDITSSNALTIDEDITSGGATNITVTADDDGTDATFFIAAGNTISSAGDLTLTADDVDIQGDLSASGQKVTIKSYTGDDAIDLGSTGTATAGTLEISNAELAWITADTFVAGGTTGTLTISDALDTPNITSVMLVADKMDLGNTLDASGGSVNLQSETINHAIDLGSSNDNGTDTLELSDAELGRITATNLVVGTSDAAAITISDAIDLTTAAEADNLILKTGAGITDDNANGALKVSGLGIEAGDDVVLDAVTLGHALGTLAADVDGALTFEQTDGFTVGSVNTVGISAAGDVTLKAVSQDIIISQNITNNGNDSTADTLTVQAGRSIVIDNGADITSSGDAFNVILNADRDATDGGNIQIGTLSQILSEGGDITLGGGTDPTATAATGYGAGDQIYGILLDDDAKLSAGAGNVSLRGTGAAETDSAQGVVIGQGLHASMVQTTSGDIAIYGTGGTDAGGDNTNNNGVAILADGQVTSDSGAITVTGVGTGASGAGILIDSGKVESTDSATISLDATGSGTAGGLKTTQSSSVPTIGGSSASGDIALTLDAASNVDSFDSSDASIQSSGTLTIKSKDAGDAIVIGGGTGSGQHFQIDNSEIGYLADGFTGIVIGRTDGTGAVTVGSSETFSDSLTIHGGSISDGSNNYVLTVTDGSNDPDLTLHATQGSIGDSTTDRLGVSVDGDLVLTTENASGDAFITSAEALSLGAMTTNATATTVDIETTGADKGITIADSSDLDENLVLTATGALTLDTGVSLGAANISMTGSDYIGTNTDDNAIETAGTLTFESSGAMNLASDTAFGLSLFELRSLKADTLELKSAGSSAITLNADLVFSDDQQGFTEAIAGTVKLTSGGALTDADDYTITATSLALTAASGDIGGSSNALNLDVDNFEANAAAGSIYIDDASGMAISGGGVTATNGSVSIASGGALAVDYGISAASGTSSIALKADTVTLSAGLTAGSGGISGTATAVDVYTGGSIQDAIAITGVDAGATVTVKSSGTYDENVTIGSTNDGLTLTSDFDPTGGTPVIIAPTSGVGISVVEATGITIEEIKVDTDANTGIQVDGASNGETVALNNVVLSGNDTGFAAQEIETLTLSNLTLSSNTTTGGTVTDVATVDFATTADTTVDTVSVDSSGLTHNANDALSFSGTIDHVKVSTAGGEDEVSLTRDNGTMEFTVDTGADTDILNLDFSNGDLDGLKWTRSAENDGYYTWTSGAGQVSYLGTETRNISGTTSPTTYDLSLAASSGTLGLTVDGFGDLVISGGASWTDAASNVDQVILAGTSGDDTLTLDMTNFGTNFPSLVFNAGGQGSSGDELVLDNGSGVLTAVTYTFDSANDGSISLSDGINSSTITYTGLEPITDNSSGADFEFRFNGGSETITLQDYAGQGYSEIDSTLGESVAFLDPASVTIDTSFGSGSDIINLDSFDNTASVGAGGGALNPDVIVNTSADGDTINITAITGSGNYSIYGGDDSDTLDLSGLTGPHAITLTNVDVDAGFDGNDGSGL